MKQSPFRRLAAALARKIFNLYGDILIAENACLEELSRVDLCVWEDIDRLSDRRGFKRTPFRAEVISAYTELLEMK